jgi:hypothetical protein
MTGTVISFNDASARLYRQAQLKREQELIEAAEAELDRTPALSVEHLIVRSLARIRDDGGRG